MKLIFIHGPIASGKLTVARALCDLTGLRLFHNHLVVDAVNAVFDFGSEPFVRLREKFWLSVFAEAAKADRSLVFTFAPERTVDPQFVPRAVAAVTERGGHVCFVALTLSPDAQARRIADASRAKFGKLTSPEFFRQLQTEGAFDFPSLPADLLLDSGIVSPADAAQRIAAAFYLA